MKKLIYILTVSLSFVFLSCKKEHIKSQPAPAVVSQAKPKATVTNPGATYDYQKAILAKRTITTN